MTERSISDRHRAILRVINEKLASSGFQCIKVMLHRRICGRFGFTVDGEASP